MPLIVLPSTSDDAATNMAIDASLLYNSPKNTAIFRHYGWTEPTATFGYAQHIDQVQNAFTKNIRLCRRLTGGGIVDHRKDWTYALILNDHLEAAQTKATELYAIVHRCIQQALAYQSVTAQLAPCPRACEQAAPATTSRPPPDQCFVYPAANDVVHPKGRKIAGAAMKRSREGLLVQGSVDRSALPDDFDFQRFSTVFQESLSRALDMDLSENCTGLLDENDLQRECRRFESDSWKNRR